MILRQMLTARKLWGVYQPNGPLLKGADLDEAIREQLHRRISSMEYEGKADPYRFKKNAILTLQRARGLKTSIGEYLQAGCYRLSGYDGGRPSPDLLRVLRKGFPERWDTRDLIYRWIGDQRNHQRVWLAKGTYILNREISFRSGCTLSEGSLVHFNSVRNIMEHEQSQIQVDLSDIRRIA